MIAVDGFIIYATAALTLFILALAAGATYDKYRRGPNHRERAKRLADKVAQAGQDETERPRP
jgi:hypothetical protein